MLILNSLYLTAAVLAGSTTLTRADVYTGPKREPLCSTSHIFSCWNGQQCIPQSLRCDGAPDCLDGSDEWSCFGPKVSPVNCSGIGQKCGVGATTACVPVSKWCDGTDDCGNNADETYCISLLSGNKVIYCDHTQDSFFCRNQGRSKIMLDRCIPWRLRCDGHFHCHDKSDESQAVCHPTVVTCNSSQFTCNKSNFCVPINKRCDGHNDCVDNSDEENCPTTEPPTKFYPKPHSCVNDHNKALCGTNTDCIPFSSWCDGFPDCPDKSDERHCRPPRNCTVHEIKCKNRQHCLKAAAWCDGFVNCGDNSDEEGCPYLPGTFNKTTCPGFWCPEDRICRDIKVRCDGVHDCHIGRADEENCNTPTKAGASSSEELLGTKTGTVKKSSSELPGTNSGAVKKSSSGDNNMVIIGVAVAAGVILLALLITAVIYRSKRKMSKDTIVSNAIIDDGIPAPIMTAEYENGTKV